MLSIDTTRTDLCEEFKERPVGRHSADLDKLLQLMRWGSVRGKVVIVCTVPEREWRLARCGKRRGDKIEILETPVFHRHRDAVWACFRARWKDITGMECPVE